MTGKFSNPDPQRCAHYATFLSHLTLAEANILFWMLFLSVLVLLCVASVQHHKSIALSAEEKNLPPTGRAAKKRRSKIRCLRMHFLSIASLCAVFTITCTIFEVFCLFSIQYCGGEDLMMIYWGFWSVLQVGSNIAILGVMLQFWIVLGDVETPSWAVALGTPVLVFAALGFVFRALWAKAMQKRKSRKDAKDLESQSEDETPVEQRDGEQKDLERQTSDTSTMVESPSMYDSSGDSSRAGSVAPPSNNMWSRDFHYILQPAPVLSAHTDRH